MKILYGKNFRLFKILKLKFSNNSHTDQSETIWGQDIRHISLYRIDLKMILGNWVQSFSECVLELSECVDKRSYAPPRCHQQPNQPLEEMKIEKRKTELKKIVKW